MTTEPTTISAVLIVKDEEDVLEECLAALAWVDEVVVYDTGSTDRTREIAARHAGVVVEGFWDDDFGAARNRALAAATSGWVLIVDADEVFTGDPAAVRRLLEGAPGTGTDRFRLIVRNKDVAAQVAGGDAASVRVFRRGAYHYAGRLHEQVVPASRTREGRIGLVPSVQLVHSGYAAAAMERHDKAQRNLDLARRDLDAAVRSGAGAEELALRQANLARSLGMAGEFRDALELADQVVADGALPGGALLALSLTMAGAAAAAADTDLVDAWLDRWESIDHTPVWARSMRVRAAIHRGDLEHARDLLDTLPTTSVDPVGRRFVKHEIADVHVQCLVGLGRGRDAARVALDAARAGYPSVAPSALHDLFSAPGRDVRTIVDALHPTLWRRYAAWCGSDPRPEAMAFLEAMASARPGDLSVLVYAAALTHRMNLVELVDWSIRVRGAGLEEMCPLITAGQDLERDARSRALAAATAVSTFDDARGLAALEAALGDVPPQDEELVLAELGVVAPGLVSATV